MERSFGLPLAIAAAVHAALLFGFPRSISHVVTVRPPVARLTEIILNKLDDDPPPIVEATRETTAIEPASLKPAGTEYLPLTPPRPDDFTVDVRPHPAVMIERAVDIIPPGSGGPRAAAGPIVSAEDLDNAPRVRYQAPPVYPFDAKRDGRTGSVVVEFTVDETGHVLAPSVIESTDRGFEESTLRAVAKWRFEPGMRGGRVVRFRMRLPVMFTLNNER